MRVMSTPPISTHAPTTEAALIRLRHLFRHTLASERLNPLLHIVTRYRQASAA